MISKYLIVLAFLSCSFYSSAQCTIPNGDFENFETIVTDGLSGPLSYELPQEWTETPLVNIFSRFVTGTGFFNKYTESDANGYALLLTRSKPGAFLNQNNGFIRFECNEVPNKLLGRVKFSGSSNRSLGQEDDLTIGAYFSTVSDTLTVSEGLNQCLFPERTKYYTTEEPIDTFIDFEIDLSDFIDSGVSYTYFTIMIKMKLLNSIGFSSEYATAVLDDLRFEYNSLSTAEINADRNPFSIYPNPVQNELFINNKGDSKITSLQLFDLTGRLILHKTNLNNSSQKLNVSHLSKGVYLLNLITDEKENHTHKFIKE